ncbi:MAG: phytanoyl-CoA dioxygenase family protein [Planctomycetes bacterium]|nr:phytanoyl-CoA dioxygenase family protein [Planctomycetota bacterium]
MRKITDAEIKHFDDHGYVICRGVLASDELAEFDRGSRGLIDEVLVGGPADKWCMRGPEGVPYYLTYLHHQPNNFSLRLLAHPFIGDLLTRMVGPDFISCYESLVFKLPTNGSSVPWHRDGNTTEGGERIFNIDIYPDRSTPANGCVWVVPGSHKWDKARAQEMIRRGREKFELPGAVAAETGPGDVLLHHVKVLHGSTVNKSGTLRRVVYFDNRALGWNERYNWFPADIMAKRCMLYQHALLTRRQHPYASDDETFAYTPPRGMPILRPGEPVDLLCAREASSHSKSDLGDIPGTEETA